jgi:hypothetical protein
MQIIGCRFLALLVSFALFTACSDENRQDTTDAGVRGCARCRANEVCVELITDCCGCESDPTRCVPSSISCGTNQCTLECAVALCGDRYGDGGVFPTCNYPGGCLRTVTGAFPCYAPYLGTGLHDAGGD